MATSGSQWEKQNDTFNRYTNTHQVNHLENRGKEIQEKRDRGCMACGMV